MMDQFGPKCGRDCAFGLLPPAGLEIAGLFGIGGGCAMNSAHDLNWEAQV